VAPRDHLHRSRPVRRRATNPYPHDPADPTDATDPTEPADPDPSWPVETPNGIRDQLGKPHVASYPLPPLPGAQQVAETEASEAEAPPALVE
jgi:hypothetical protein